MFSLRQILSVLVIFPVLVACEGDVFAPKPGLYSVEVEVLADDCMQGYGAEPFASQVAIDAKRLTVGLAQELEGEPNAIEDAYFDREPSERIHYTSHPVSVKRGACMTLTHTSTVSLDTEDSFYVEEQAQWVKQSGCIEAEDETAVMPADSCTARRLFMFQREAADGE